MPDREGREERVAKALFLNERREPTPDPLPAHWWEQVRPETRRIYLSDARAAIAALSVSGEGGQSAQMVLDADDLVALESSPSVSDEEEGRGLILSPAEARNVVDAALGDDHDADQLEATIQRIGDAADAFLSGAGEEGRNDE
ncbi:MAG TPA: hypothetical protein VMF31_10685 [Solirubrobacterales bacterium]|nr:hypothetical protein [Solirubrobacterales bacterium]